MAKGRLHSVRAAGLLAVIACEPGSPDAPKPVGCDEGFEDWPCARDMCRACQERGGELRMTDSSPPSLACSGEDGKPIFPEEDFCRRPYCTESVEPVDEAAAAEFLGPVAGEHIVPLTWFPADTRGLESVAPPAGTETDLTIVVEPVGAVELVRSDLVVPETEGVPDFPGDHFGCGEGLAVDATVVLTTADGRLAETLDVRLSAIAFPDSTPFASGSVALDHLPPGLNVVPEDMTTVEDVRAAISFPPEGVSGGITVELFYAGDVVAGGSFVVVANW
jgi:hypothetical protein